MNDSIDYARQVSQAVLDRLGDLSPPWQVLAVEEHVETSAPPPGLTVPNSLLVTIGGEDGSVQVYFSLDVPVDEATAATAGQIQDHAIEESVGAALPPCPGHRHPLSARSIDGVANWVCPHDATYHREPILPPG
ncbi:hypothetical protein [Amycolatopsis sp. cmx-11-12]|uniref:hypothetical protein n=1 Tax=Amycolatopsis sp. cmx-11-12 TaxID=2785795 RepID=UPI003916E451